MEKTPHKGGRDSCPSPQESRHLPLEPGEQILFASIRDEKDVVGMAADEEPRFVGGLILVPFLSRSQDVDRLTGKNEPFGTAQTFVK